MSSNKKNTKAIERKMIFFIIGFLVIQTARLACGTCVFQSDFGFVLNCNFRKSGLVRVRNLGGVKAHFGLGFSVGDELGFAESIGNLEDSRRRAISYKNGLPTNEVGVLPAVQQSKAEAVDREAAASALPNNINPELMQLLQKHLAKANSIDKPVKQAKKMPLMTEARPLPLGVPAFRPIPPKRPETYEAQRRTNLAMDTSRRNGSTLLMQNPSLGPVPSFQDMPSSAYKVTDSQGSQANYLQFEQPRFDLKDIRVEELAAAANVSVNTIKRAIYLREQQMQLEQRALLAAKLRQEYLRTSTAKPPPIIVNLPTVSPTETTHSPKPNALLYSNKNKHINSNKIPDHHVAKVMNAPREYYPVGYDKNFDDNFKSKVDLPPTNFECSQQKHFPGLYADPDLGCMVFHLCALSDDGMMRKFFLCPENTLFDQTILKCNWWFYIDCAASPSIYDSNIPISKSYQLMKSLVYFSKFSNNNNNSNERTLKMNVYDLLTPARNETTTTASIIEATSEDHHRTEADDSDAVKLNSTALDL